MSQSKTTVSFIDKLTEAIAANQSLLCVGLDPQPHRYAKHFAEPFTPAALVDWGQAIIKQTHDQVCCYKPNAAFYLQYGPEGLAALRQTIEAVPENIPVLLDVKWGDIGSTAEAYAHAAFEALGVDAVTLNPYLGADSIAPFLAYPGKMVFVLCYTSNPSAAAVQAAGNPGRRLFEQIARQAQQWGAADQLGFVVGATQPQALAQVRQLAPDRWILAPGVGAQGGDLQATLAAGLNGQQRGLIVPVSRGVIYADDPRQAATTLRNDITQAGANLTPTATVPHEALILQLHEAGCIRFGDFTLASGKQSPIYIDLRRISSHPDLLRLVAQTYADLLQPLTFDRLAAVPYAALTIGTAAALAANQPLIYPRKEAKAYGTGKNIEGVYAPGERVAIIEDLVTSGGSVIKAAEQLVAADLTVADVVVLIDREQGGPENLAQAGYRLHAALRLSEMLDVLARHNRLSAEKLAEVKAGLKPG